MKIVIREWWKAKLGCLCLLGYMFVSVMYLVLKTWAMTLLARTINQGTERMVENMLFIGIVYLSTSVLSSAQTLLRHHATHQSYTHLINRYSDKELDADYQMFLQFSCSKIVTLTEQVWKITNLGAELADAGVKVINVIVLLYYIYLIAPELMVPIAIIYIAAGFMIRKIFIYDVRFDSEADRLKRKRNQEIEETINGFVEVRSFCTKERHRASIHDLNQQVMNFKTKMTSVSSGLSFVLEVISGIASIIGIWFVITSISNGGTISPAEGITLIMYIWRLADPLCDAIYIAGSISDGLSAIDAYDEFISYQNHVADNGNIELSEFRNSITLEHVSFSYEDSDSVLNNISLKIKKGEKIGICGKSGGGKTTLFKLLQKFYVPDRGTIYIDGVNYRDVETDSLRKRIGVVHQDSHIFNGTIYDNVRYGNQNATEYEVIEACKKANIYDFIVGLKDKFNTQVGPRGLKLSGGQIQRIALARMFLMDPEIILLDEATSALDNESETLIQEVLTAYADRTIITIAHRLSTIQDSDCIYVLDNGGIAEAGTHKELLEKGGIYASLNK